MFHTLGKDGRDAHCATNVVCITSSSEGIGKNIDYEYVPLYVPMVTICFGPPKSDVNDQWISAIN